MKIIKSIIFLLLAVCISMSGQTECREKQLAKCFEASQNSTDSLAKVNFFRAFPNDFQSFKCLFVNRKGALYENHFEYVVEFGTSLRYVSCHEWAAKLISLAQEGKWGPDAVFMLQAVMIEQFRKEGRKFSMEMRTYNYQQLFNFFYFYLNDINPNYSGLPVELNVLSEREKEIAEKAMREVNNR